MNELHYGVVVGITHYPGGYDTLTGPKNDAIKFADWLTDPHQGGLPPKNVHELLTPVPPPGERSSAKPIKRLIDEAIWDVCQDLNAALNEVPEHVRPSLRDASRLYVFVAGHGVMPGGGAVALLDARATPGWQSNIELGSYLEHFVRDGSFAEVCIFADCCRIDSLLVNPGLPEFDVPAEPGDTVEYILAMACGANGLALEETAATIAPDDRRGHFSRALLEGLKGGAADPETGLVTKGALTNYVDIALDRHSRTAPTRRQKQEIRQSGREIIFGPARTTAKAVMGSPSPPLGRDHRRVTIMFPEYFNEKVYLIAPDNSQLYWDASDGPWTQRLYDGVWAVRSEHSSGIPFANNGVFIVAGENLDVQL